MLSLARFFSYTRFVESCLNRERKEREVENQRHQTEILRLRTERDREWKRANEAEVMGHKVEAETRFALARVIHVPLSPSDLVDYQQAQRRNGEGKAPVSGVRGVNESRRKREAESAEMADRRVKEERMAAEAARFAGRSES